MLSTTVAATATTTHDVLIKPTIRKKLLTALRTYAGLKDQEKVLKLAKKKCSKQVEEIQLELGETSLSVDGFKSTIVAPVRKVLNRKKFVAKGGDLALLDASYDEVLGASYVKITVPGGGDVDEE